MNGLTQLHSKFEATEGYKRSYLKIQNNGQGNLKRSDSFPCPAGGVVQLKPALRMLSSPSSTGPAWTRSSQVFWWATAAFTALWLLVETAKEDSQEEIEASVRHGDTHL